MKRFVLKLEANEKGSTMLNPIQKILFNANVVLSISVYDTSFSYQSIHPDNVWIIEKI